MAFHFCSFKILNKRRGESKYGSEIELNLAKRTSHFPLSSIFSATRSITVETKFITEIVKSFHIFNKITNCIFYVGPCDFLTELNNRGICGSFGECELPEYWEEGVPPFYHWRG